jgi:glycosyltransferase involved in cell wall biosynthesis
MAHPPSVRRWSPMKKVGVSSVEWVCSSPAPYTSYMFRILNAALPVDFRIHFTRAGSTAHYWSTPLAKGFPARVYDRCWGIDFQLVKTVVRNHSGLFVSNCWQDLTTELLIVYLALRGRRYILWSDTPDLRKRRTLLKRVARSLFLRFAFRRAYAVMGTGTPALAVFQNMGCPAEKLVNFPYIIDVEEFGPPGGDLAGLGSPVVFGSCGRLDVAKGFDIALEALAAAFLHNRTGFRYRIAGDGPEKANLEALAFRLGIRDQVEFVQWLEPAELPAFYESLDIQLHPARVEPYGVAVLEGMAAGKVVVASDDTGAAVDRIVSGENGFIHRSGDVEDLASAIQRVIALAPGSVRSLQERARESARLWAADKAVETFRRLLDGANHALRR